MRAHEVRVQPLVTAGLVKCAAEVPCGAILVNREKVTSRSVVPAIPLWYEDVFFACKDCGNQERWTARQQQWWYEVARGEIETTAIRCKSCRQKKRAADAAATERTRQHKLVKAQSKAATLAEKLAAQGPEGFAVLNLPVTALSLPKRLWPVLKAHGFKTVGDLVAHDTGSVPREFYQSDMKLIRTLLEKLGLTFIGAPVPRL